MKVQEVMQVEPINTSLPSMMKGSKDKQKYPLNFIANGDLEMTINIEKK